jgi:hypothetical protein
MFSDAPFRGYSMGNNYWSDTISTQYIYRTGFISTWISKKISLILHSTLSPERVKLILLSVYKYENNMTFLV